MNTISITYNYKWTLKNKENYVFSDCGKCFNLLRNKQVKKVLKGYTIGFNINGKFHSLNNLRTELIKIKTIDYPF